MWKIAILTSFERTLKKLTRYEKKQVAASLEAFNAFLSYGGNVSRTVHLKLVATLDIDCQVRTLRGSRKTAHVRDATLRESEIHARRKINSDKYEFRVSSRIRIVVKQEKDTFYLVLVGSHNDVRRYLREYR